MSTVVFSGPVLKMLDRRLSEDVDDAVAPRL